MTNFQPLPEWISVGLVFENEGIRWEVRAIVDEKAVCREGTGLYAVFDGTYFLRVGTDIRIIMPKGLPKTPFVENDTY